MKWVARILVMMMLFITAPLRGTHIVGGEMTYTYLGNNQYKLRLDLYIDCIKGNPQAIESDRYALFAIFTGSNRQMLSGYPVSVSRKGPERIEKTNYNCIAVKPNACVDHYWYERTVTLSPRTGGYYVSFQRCCRNGTINNILDPGGTGANYWAFIPNKNKIGSENSAAVFKQLPPNFLCTNTELRFDHSAKDADGDSLVYSLITPFTAGDRDYPRPDDNNSGIMDRPYFDNISWRAGYSSADPIDGNPKMKIDPNTGMLTLTPTRAGQYVVGIAVDEYRDNQVIAQTIRDYQFNVQACIVDVVASFFAPKYICGFEYEFRNLSSGAQRYHWDFGVEDRTDDTSNLGKPTYTYPEAGTYKVKLIAHKNNCADTFTITVNVVEPEKPTLPNDTTLCPGEKVVLKSDIVGDAYRWNNGQFTDSITVDQKGTYILTVIKNTCEWSDTMFVDIDEYEVNAYGDTLICSDDQFSHEIGADFNPNTSYSWSNGVDNISQTVTDTGWYEVTATTEYGCITTDMVRVDRFPAVDVAVSDTMVCEGTSVTFEATSSKPEATFSWSNGAQGPTMTTDVKGDYEVIAKVGLCTSRDQFELSHFPNQLELGNDLRFCDKIDTIIGLDNPNFTNIIWNREIPSAEYRVNSPGMVHVSVTNKFGCTERDSINVFLFFSPDLDLGSDTTVCLSENPTLDAGPGMFSYRWGNGAKTRKIKAYDSGIYTVKIINKDGCFTLDSVWVNKRRDLYPSEIYMPNAFTPNGDGINDLYPLNKFQIKGAEYHLRLYNRWGEKLADYKSPDFNWDGNINGTEAPGGVYVYTITWLGCDNRRRSLKGDFTLLR